jgi:hypothetical protein
MHAGSAAEKAASKRSLPVALPGPPGHEHLRPLSPPDPEDDVTRREGEPLGEFMLRAVGAVAEALFATEEGAPDPDRIAWVVKDFDHFCAVAPGRARGVMQLCLFALSWVAPLFVFRPFVPLASLPLPLRTEALERIEASVLGPAALGPKAILCLLWLEHPDTQRETGTTVTPRGETS